MTTSIPTSLSSLRASETRLGVTANNTANVRSTVKEQNDGTVVNDPYRAQDALQISTEPGVRSVVRESTPSTREVYDPSSPVANEKGIVNTPNVNLEKETIQRVLARNDFQANLKTVQASLKMTDSLLKITDEDPR
ncbi:MAG: hypothetical protein J0L97_02335 [Alphaproteobacteria bacterium]|nr:hypothetical protein [Alphaproteobacteria bacterium]